MSGVQGLVASYGGKKINLVLNLDAANYVALPTNASTISGTGSFPITVNNTGASLSYSSANGGYWTKSNTTALNDFFTFGPDYSAASKPYTVMMIYRSVGATGGRLLNANTASPDWLMGLWGSPTFVQNIAFNGAFIGSNSTAANGLWQMGWFTYNGGTPSATSNSYIANATVNDVSGPAGTFGTGASGGGFNGLRLWGRFSNATTITEPVRADVGLVKVWDGVLTLSQIQTEWATYHTRFGI